MMFSIPYEILLSAIGTIALSNLSLQLFYKAFELKWPELYFSVNDKTALFVSTSWQRYVAFKVLPVFVAIVFSAGVLMRDASMNVTLIVSVASVIVYGFSTDGRSIYRILARSKKVHTFFNSWYQILLHVITIIVFVCVGILAGWISKSQWVSAVTPTPAGLVDNLWSSLLVVLLAIYLKEVYSSQGLSEDILFRRSQENIDPDIFLEIDRMSNLESANPSLVKAICIVENLQRPIWVRKIETISNRFRSEGTYGIMQVNSKKPISDLDSVGISIEKFFRSTSGLVDVDGLRKIVAKYNNDERYIDIVLKVMSYLDYSAVNYEG